MRILVLIIFMFLFSCKEDKKHEINHSSEISKKIKLKKLSKQKGTEFYDEIIALKENDNFTFLNYISKIPKDNLPINANDYEFLLIKKGKCSDGFSKKYDVNKKAVNNYPFFLVNDYSFDSIRKAKIIKVESLKSTISNFSMQEALKEVDSEIDSYYLIPIFYFPVESIYVIGYIHTIIGYKREKIFSGIVLKTYDKEGNILDGKYDEVHLLLIYNGDSLCYEKYSNISEDYILTEKRKSNDFESKYSNITVKYKITKEGLKIIE